MNTAFSIGKRPNLKEVVLCQYGLGDHFTAFTCSVERFDEEVVEVVRRRVLKRNPFTHIEKRMYVPVCNLFHKAYDQYKWLEFWHPVFSRLKTRVSIDGLMPGVLMRMPGGYIYTVSSLDLKSGGQKIKFVGPKTSVDTLTSEQSVKILLAEVVW